MAGEIAKNKHLINAPAGSGKTTNIRTRLKSICLKEPKSKILCITYTNRAADELKKDLDSANVTVVSVGSSRPRFVGSNEPLFVGKPEANR